MAHAARLQSNPQYLIKGRDHDSYTRFFPSSSPLIFPSLKGVPLQMRPGLEFADIKQIALWGKVFHHLAPGDIRWPSGTPVNQISADILKGIEGMIRLIILEYDLPATVEVGITEEGALKILLWAFGDNYYPIFYKDTLEAVKPISKNLHKLVREALVLMGSRNLMNWTDVKDMLMDNLEMMYEEEEIPAMKKQYEKCGPSVSPFIRCEKGSLASRIEVFKKSVQRLKPRGVKQKQVAELLNAVALVVDSRVIFEFSPSDYEDMHIELGRIMPILYSIKDDVSDYHYEEMVRHEVI
ncbi:MAG: hypothetical protein ACHQYP_09220 [Nitrospiria bacterium]